MSNQATGVVDQRIAKALSHPVRAHILQILNDRVASPNEIAEEMKEPLGNVSYHVRALLNLGCVELVDTQPRRGAIEHYYKAVARPFFSDNDWTKLPRSARHAISDRTLESIWTDVAGSMEDGSFESRADRHLSRTALLLDEQAWEELNEILKGVLEDALRLETESANRRAESGEEGINTKLALMHFETSTASGGSSKKQPARRKARATVKA